MGQIREEGSWLFWWWFWGKEKRQHYNTQSPIRQLECSPEVEYIQIKASWHCCACLRRKVSTVLGTAFFGVVCRTGPIRSGWVTCANEKLEIGKLKRRGAGMAIKIFPFPCQGTVQRGWRPGMGRTDGLSVKSLCRNLHL